ncbi:hypothetical protein QR685DRAFT_550209 [Neurospora intermedia]|uniref:Uncharacterized protein n=1 Tax=Neurospora intermedia TaxID=5142 RepID=A0ABR3DSN1_NEUIN
MDLCGSVPPVPPPEAPAKPPPFGSTNPAVLNDPRTQSWTSRQSPHSQAFPSFDFPLLRDLTWIPKGLNWTLPGRKRVKTQLPPGQTPHPALCQQLRQPVTTESTNPAVGCYSVRPKACHRQKSSRPSGFMGKFGLRLLDDVNIEEGMTTQLSQMTTRLQQRGSPSI